MDQGFRSDWGRGRRGIRRRISRYVVVGLFLASVGLVQSPDGVVATETGNLRKVEPGHHKQHRLPFHQQQQQQRQRQRQKQRQQRQGHRQGESTARWGERYEKHRLGSPSLGESEIRGVEGGEDEEHEEHEEEEEERGLRLEFRHRTVVPMNIPPTNPCPIIKHHSIFEMTDAVVVGAEDVWRRLKKALSARKSCLRPPCCKGVHRHTYSGLDLGEEMSHVQGAIVVRRPDLTQNADVLAPAHSLDFVATMQTYFASAESSLLRWMVDAAESNVTAKHHVSAHYGQLLEVNPFLFAIEKGDAAAARMLTPYCQEKDTHGGSERTIEDCLRTPTLVSMADMFISRAGFLWNDQDLIAPISCATERDLEAMQGQFRVNETRRTSAVRTYEKVFVMTQEYTPNHYHFTVEHLPRIMFMLDILLEEKDIKVAIHFHGGDTLHDLSKVLEAHLELMELLGIDRERIIPVEDDIHAHLAILPTSTVCGDPDTHMINMLRNKLLQALYPSTGGVPPPPPRPVILLVVRKHLRGLWNNDAVRSALESNFPDYDVVEFFGIGSVRTQLDAFATASMVVAPHGAGLSNIIVSPLHTPVLEVGPISCPPCFVRLSLKLHHLYARHPAGEWDSECFRWYEPDVDEVVTLARDLLAAKQEADAVDPPSAYGLRP